MEKYSLSLVCVMTISMCGCGKATEQAVEQESYTIEYYEFAGVQLSFGWKRNFQYLSRKQRNLMCIKAKEHALLDGKNSIADKHLHIIHVRHNETDSSIFPVIKCRTVPVSYLRTEDPYKHIVILMEKNKFIEHGLYEFEVESVPSRPRSCADVTQDLREHGEPSRKRSEEASNIEYQMNEFPRNTIPYNKDRLFICVAAKKSASNWPVLRTEEIEDAQIFYVDRMKNVMERIVAIDCVSDPPMHVMFETPINLRVFVTDPENQLMVQTLKNESALL